MKEGLEEFLKRIEAKPTNETLIDRFVTLVLEEEVLERMLYLKKLVGLLLTPNPYAALKAAALELQEARKEKLTKEYEVGALKDVESCFLKLDKMDNAQLVREEINKLQGEMSRETSSTRARAAPPPNIPQPESEAEEDIEPPSRQARVHFRLPQPEDDGLLPMDERTAQHRPSDYDNAPPSLPKTGQRTVPPLAPEPYSSAPPAMNNDFDPNAFGYEPRRKSQAPDTSTSFLGQKEFYDKNLEETDDRQDESTKRSSLSKVSGIKVGPNLLDSPDDREQPARPRNIASVFESTDVFSGQRGMQQEPPDRIPVGEYPPRVEEKPAKAEAPKSKGRPRPAFESNDYVGDSNAMFQESQHVHFPENTSNRSMTRQEMRGSSQGDRDRDPVISSPLENTEILPDSRMISAPSIFENEATRQLDPDELMHSNMPIMPVEPAFPPREFDLPPYDFPAKSNEKPSSKAAPAKEKAKKSSDPFAGIRESSPANRDVFVGEKAAEPVLNDPFAPVKPSNASARDPFAAVPRETQDPFASVKDPVAIDSRMPQRDAFAAIREMQSENPFASTREGMNPVKEAISFPKDVPTSRPAPSPAGTPKSLPQATEPRWSLLRDRLRLLTGIQISRSHASDFVLRLLGENSSRDEQQEVLSIFLRVLDTTRQPVAEQRFLAFLFEELQPKALHQLLGALKIGDQTVVFFVDYLQTLVKERQLRRTLNVIHAVIVVGLDLTWYQEAYRFLLQVWPELGLKGWHWLEEEGPMAFCERLSVREDLLPATLLA